MNLLRIHLRILVLAYFVDVCHFRYNSLLPLLNFQHDLQAQICKTHLPTLNIGVYATWSGWLDEGLRSTLASSVMPPKNSQNKAAESLGLWHPKASPRLSTGKIQHKANRPQSSPELSGSVLFTSHTAGVTEIYCAHFWMCCFSSVLPHRNPHPYYGSTTVTLCLGTYLPCFAGSQYGEHPKEPPGQMEVVGGLVESSGRSQLGCQFSRILEKCNVKTLQIPFWDQVPPKIVPDEMPLDDYTD